MDCITCGRELIGYNIERTASICNENHMLCNECNDKYAHVCPFCEEKTLYCDILRCDYQSIILLIDMQRQFPQKRKSLHPLADHETEYLDAEDEVIEEYVVVEEEEEDEEEEEEEKEGEEEEEVVVEEVIADGWTDIEEANRNDNEPNETYKCVDSVLVRKSKTKKCDTEEKAKDLARDGSWTDYFDFREEEQCDGAASVSPTPSWAAMSSEEELEIKPKLSGCLKCHPLPESSLQLKMKNKSFCAQVFSYNLSVNNARPQQNMKYVPLGHNKNKSTAFTLEKEDEYETSLQEEDKDEQGEDEQGEDEQSEDGAHRMRKVCSLLFPESDRPPKNMPMLDYTTRFYHTTPKRLNRWHNVNKNPDNVLNLDDEQLFVWRNVKKGDNEFQSLFVVVKPKGDKRMVALLQKLQTIDDTYFYVNGE